MGTIDMFPKRPGVEPRFAREFRDSQREPLREVIRSSHPDITDTEADKKIEEVQRPKPLQLVTITDSPRLPRSQRPFGTLKLVA